MDQTLGPGDAKQKRNEGGGDWGIRLPASGWEGDAAAGETGYLRSPRPSRWPAGGT